MPLWNSVKSSGSDVGLERFDVHDAPGHESAKLLAPLQDVGDLGAVVGRTVERRLGDFLVADRNAEAGAEGAQLVFVQLLLLVRDVLPFARFADAVALDRAGEDDGRLPGVLDGGLVRRVDLDRIVPAERQLLQLLVGQMLDHLEQPRVGAPEVLPDVGARLDRVLLVLAVDDFAHPLDEQAVAVLLEQRVPLAAPDDLEHVPAGAAEDRLELLDDLPVAADRTVEALKVAVDDEDQIVELFAGGEGDGAKRFGFVGLAVAEEGPDLRVGSLLQPAILEVAHEARLVDRADRPEAHRDGRELPEVGHQPRVRIRRQPAARPQLAAEVLELLDADATLEERAGVDAGRRVTLEVDDVAVVVVALALEEVIQPDLVERRRRRIGRNVAADALFQLVRLDHHRQRVPAHQALDAALDFAAAGKRRLLGRGDGVDVGGVGGERWLDAAATGMILEERQEPGDPCRPSGLQHVIERLEPFPRLERFQLGRVLRGCATHASSCGSVQLPILLSDLLMPPHDSVRRSCRSAQASTHLLSRASAARA